MEHQQGTQRKSLAAWATEQSPDARMQLGNEAGRPEREDSQIHGRLTNKWPCLPKACLTPFGTVNSGLFFFFLIRLNKTLNT